MVAILYRLVISAIGRPTQKMWITTPITVNFNENWPRWYADSGNTTYCMKK